MSQRHNTARRRNYGRRQHEIRERRPETSRRVEWERPPAVDEATANDDRRVADLDEERPAAAGPDGYGGAHL